MYQWRSSDPNIASVDDKGVVTAQKPGSATITAFASNGQALRCAVTVTSEVGKVTLNKADLLLKTVGSQEALCATVAVESGGSVPITWVTSNPGVATVDTNGVVTAHGVLHGGVKRKAVFLEDVSAEVSIHSRTFLL